MENESTLISLLQTELITSLGDRFLINSQPLPSGARTNSQSQPDLVIWPQDGSKRPYIVELKMTSENYDLPLSVANQTKRIIEENQETNPRMILATTSRVSNLLRMELDDQNVTVIKSDVPSDLAYDISQLIRMKQDAS